MGAGLGLSFVKGTSIMPTHIVDIELSEPFSAITLPVGFDGVLGLVRWHRKPIGLVRVQAAEGRVSPQQLQQAIERQVQIPSENATLPDSALQLVSIVVCSHERPEDLRRCLDTLLPHAAAGHEVIVVDNAPCSPRTAEVASRYPFRYLQEPQIGLNNARNCGLQAASYAVVAYIDDDAAADPDWVKALVQPFESPSVGCVTGLVLPSELETHAQEMFEVYSIQRRTFARQVFSTPGTAPAAAGVAGVGANMAVRRELALRLGGFDPRLDGGTLTCSGGDTDMFARLLDAGSEIVYTPEALVWHRHRRDEAALARCIFGYGVGLYSFLTKRLIEERDYRALIIAARWFVGPLVKAAIRRIGREPAVSLSLLLREASGACIGPLRFWQQNLRQQRALMQRLPQPNLHQQGDQA